jgi:hypothetical protein
MFIHFYFLSEYVAALVCCITSGAKIEIHCSVGRNCGVGVIMFRSNLLSPSSGQINLPSWQRQRIPLKRLYTHTRLHITSEKMGTVMFTPVRTRNFIYLICDLPYRSRTHSKAVLMFRHLAPSYRRFFLSTVTV